MYALGNNAGNKQNLPAIFFVLLSSVTCFSILKMEAI
jgi:hypothetical protein